MINPFLSQIASRESQIASARAEISNLHTELDTLRRRRRRLEDLQMRYAGCIRSYQRNNDILARNTISIQGIQKVKLANHSSRELRLRTTGNVRNAADRSTTAVTRRIDDELERLRADIRQREQRIDTLQGQIAAHNNHIANLRAQSAAWQPLGI